MAERARPRIWWDGAPPGLPAVLSSVDDVARVCEAAGLTETHPDGAGRRRFTDADVTVVVSADTRMLDPGHWHVERSEWLVSGRYGSPTTVLWSAIRADRGGEPS